ncbi:MAG: hypothetical protein ABFD07_07345, partial [Methanobacterium sp.]
MALDQINAANYIKSRRNNLETRRALDPIQRRFNFCGKIKRSLISPSLHTFIFISSHKNFLYLMIMDCKNAYLSL